MLLLFLKLLEKSEGDPRRLQLDLLELAYSLTEQTGPAQALLSAHRRNETFQPVATERPIKPDDALLRRLLSTEKDVESATAWLGLRRSFTHAFGYFSLLQAGIDLGALPVKFRESQREEVEAVLGNGVVYERLTEDDSPFPLAARLLYMQLDAEIQEEERARRRTEKQDGFLALTSIYASFGQDDDLATLHVCFRNGCGRECTPETLLEEFSNLGFVRYAFDELEERDELDTSAPPSAVRGIFTFLHLARTLIESWGEPGSPLRSALVGVFAPYVMLARQQATWFAGWMERFVSSCADLDPEELRRLEIPQSVAQDAAKEVVTLLEILGAEASGLTGPQGKPNPIDRPGAPSAKEEQKHEEKVVVLRELELT